ncbi:mediator of RNA polymerase II transcription subunit 25 isoform X2 [Fopius arisanus]|nr:PREDICTED: mediator of RNA polymerase II transcription subunit 25-like isoform X2 [Fopius arisanus]XP_011297130.1 PREDICTED: mediator of RNA polymerase II transcription subunit 25-like isoform X2 [Fopius arisanus]XP_011297131.1 PREDICTED: mediator of RNA polymerase II transcription subunit 25-like isoform X2 [Fopius arisanus]XP_011297132.1 PREDICTED: mediator of RNA polymerase II transcription subunit 25-like isoform X2 [Fopius arisanus]XP_011297133.1 PREDICTED: mediator of RNA polymerase II
MVPGPSEHGIQADVIFVIEGTAVNGAYLNDLKSNYLIPTLEYFSQGNIEDRDYVAESNTALYGIVVYHAADCLPAPTTATLGPFSNPHKLLLTLERLEMIGGRGESHANIGEGLATALLCFEDLQMIREPSTNSQKHCILICNSPPYQTAVQESSKFVGHTVENLAGLFQERNIVLSILSPRKIPALLRLFEKAGGDLQTSQTKNYAKDPRHLVLLRNYHLKERPVSPPTIVGQSIHQTSSTGAQIPLSPLQNHESPIVNQGYQTVSQSSQSHTPMNPSGVFRNPTPGSINHQSGAAAVGAINVGEMNPGRPGFNPQIPGPPNYHAAATRAAQSRWKAPFINAEGVQNNQGSALIAQLSQPPSSFGLNVQFNQRMEANGGSVMSSNCPQQQQTSQNPSSLCQRNQAQGQAQSQGQSLQPQSQTLYSSVTPTQHQEQVGLQTMQIASSTQQNHSVISGADGEVQQGAPTSHPSLRLSGNVQSNNIQQVSHISSSGIERPMIWQGILEWLEKPKNPSSIQQQTRQVPCQVSATVKEGEPELKVESWPRKLIMQLMPKQLIGSIGGGYLNNSKSVLFHPTPCEALDSLMKVMSTGFAGCVHFPSSSPLQNCDIKVLILLYTVGKRAYLGFIPNDQIAFVDRLQKVIQQQNTTQALIRQNQIFSQGGSGTPGNKLSGTILGSAPMSQGGILMSQTNTIALGGGQITQNVVPSNNQQQAITNSGPQSQMNLQTGGLQSSAVGSGASSGMIVQQRPTFEGMDIARQQNLIKIHQLRQTLEAAQQQEAHYQQTQLDIHQNLDVTQHQEMQYQQMEVQQAQKVLNVNSGIIGQQSNTQRMRSTMTNNLGLRHLLQQQQPQQYRQLLGMGTPKGEITTRPMTTNNSHNQQFDDVTNFDYMP